ncbi:amino acid ABC transporter substrate-binding protein [Comamonas humi]
MRLLLPLLALVTAAWSSAGLAQTTPDTWDKIRNTRSVTVGFRPDSIPFSYATEGSAPVGYAIDICKSLLASLQKELQLPALQISYRAINGQTRFTDLASGAIDLDCSNTTNTRERRETKQVSFSMPYYIAGARVLAASGSKIEALADASGKKVITTKGTTSVAILKEKEDLGGLRFTKSECVNHGECFAALQKRAVDAWVMDDIVLASFRAQAEKPGDYKMVGKLLSIEPLSLMMRASDTRLKKFFDGEMRRMAQSHEIGTLYKKWFESPLPGKGFNLNIPMPYLLSDMLRYPSDQFDN